MARTQTEARIASIERSLTDRIERLEEQVSRLSKQVDAAGPTPETAWWKKIVGVFANDPEFEEAMRLGREYREAQRPDDENAQEPA